MKPHLERQRASRKKLLRAVRNWARQTKATSPGGTQYTTLGVDGNGNPVEIVVTLAMLPRLKDE